MYPVSLSSFGRKTFMSHYCTPVALPCMPQVGQAWISNGRRSKVPTVHVLLLLQHKAAGKDTAHLSFLACSHQPKTEIINLCIRRKPKHWATGKGSDGKWLIWHRRGELHSSLLHSGFLVSTDHISTELTSRWEKYIPPKHKRLHASLFFLPVLLQLMCVQPLPSFPASFLALPACKESYCQISVLDVWLHFSVKLIQEIWKSNLDSEPRKKILNIRNSWLWIGQEVFLNPDSIHLHGLVCYLSNCKNLTRSSSFMNKNCIKLLITRLT